MEIEAALQSDTREGSAPCAHLFLGLLYREGRRLDEALAVFERGRELFPANPWLALESAVTYSWNGDLETALAAYSEARSLAPHERAPRAGEARVLGWMGKVDRAEAIWLGLIQTHGRHVEVLNGLAGLYRTQLRRRAATSLYEEALQLDPENADAREGLVQLARMQALESFSSSNVPGSQQPAVYGLRWRPRLGTSSVLLFSRDPTVSRRPTAFASFEPATSLALRQEQEVAGGVRLAGSVEVRRGPEFDTRRIGFSASRAFGRRLTLEVSRVREVYGESESNETALGVDLRGPAQTSWSLRLADIAREPGAVRSVRRGRSISPASFSLGVRRYFSRGVVFGSYSRSRGATEFRSAEVGGHLHVGGQFSLWSSARRVNGAYRDTSVSVGLRLLN